MDFLKKKAKSFLIGYIKISNFQEIISTILEMIFYLAAMNKANLLLPFEADVQKYLMFALLLIILFTRIFIRLLSIIILNTFLLLPFNSLSYAAFFLMLMCVVIDICGRLNYAKDETANSRKILHWSLIASTLVLSNEFYAFYISIGGLLILHIIASLELFYNKLQQELILRTYLFGISFQALTFAPLEWLPRIEIAIICSQTIYMLQQKFKKDESFEEMISQKMHSKLVYLILSYLDGEHYDSSFEAKLSKLTNKDRTIIYHTMLSFIDPCETMQDTILKGCILLKQNKLIKCKMALIEAQKALKFYSLWDKLLIYRLEEEFLEFYNYEKEKVKINNLEDYFFNENLINLIGKSTDAWLLLWKYTFETETHSEKLLIILRKVLKFTKEVNKSYEEENEFIKCISVKLLYSSYLIEITNDIVKARKVFEEIRFNREFEIDLNTNNKIYLCLEGEEIKKVGSNLMRLLGYSTKELENKSISIFLPEFCRAEHSEAAKEFYTEKSEELMIYGKEVVIRHKNGYYKPVSIVLSLFYAEKLFLQGYIHVLKENDYDWLYFVCMADNSLIEYSQEVADLFPNRKLTRFTDVFSSEQPSGNIMQQSSSGVRIYNPFYTFTLKKEPIVLYVSLKNIKEESPPPIFESIYKNVNIVPSENAFEGKKQLKFIIVIIALFVLLICFKIYQLSAEDSLENLNQNTISLITFLQGYYYNAIKVGIDFNYKQLAFYYSNSFQKSTEINSILYLQQNNEYFSEYTTNIFKRNDNLTFSTYNLTVEFETDVFIFNRSAEMREVVNEQIIANTLLLFAEALTDYEAKLLNSFSDGTFLQIVGFFSLAIEIIVMTAVLIIFCYLDFNVRTREFEVFMEIGNLENRRDFLIRARTLSLNISLENEKTNQKNEEELQFEEISRRLEDTFNKSLTFTGMLLPSSLETGNRFKAEVSSNLIEFEVSIRKRENLKFVVYILISLLFIVVSSYNEIQNGYIRSFSPIQSSQNKLTLLKTSILYSQNVITLLTTLNSKLSAPNLVEYALNELRFTIAKYNASKIIYPTFPEVNVAEFAVFADWLSQIRYKNLCEYLECLPEYRSEINIIYTTTIQKMMESIMNLAQNISNINNFFKYQKKTLDVILYSEELIRNLMKNVLDSHEISFNLYIENYYENKKTIVLLLIPFFLLFALTFIIFLKVFLKPYEELITEVSKLLIKEKEL